jgi:hypothetical protein
MVMNAGFAAYLAKKKTGKTDKLTPGDTVDPTMNPMAVLPNQMVSAIKKSPAGVIPAGLAKYVASKKKTKTKAKAKKPTNFVWGK